MFKSDEGSSMVGLIYDLAIWMLLILRGEPVYLWQRILRIHSGEKSGSTSQNLGMNLFDTVSA